MRFPLRIFPLLFLAACSGPAPQLPYVESVSPEGEPVRTYADARLDARAGEGLLQVQAGKLVFKGEQAFRRILLEDVVAKLKDGSNAEVLALNAGRVFIAAPYDQLELSENVLIDAAAQGQAEMDSLIWRLGEKEFHTEGAVRLLVKQGIIEGEGIRATLNLSHFQIYKVHGYTPLQEK